MSQVTQPAKTLIIGDSIDLEHMSATYENPYLYAPIGSRFDPKSRAGRHAGKGNYLMLDGHVEALPPGMDITYFQKIK
jgi:prepilin-type processing-associated H-X9-DG protein